MKLQEFIAFWLTNIVSIECKKSTALNYKTVTNKHIIPTLGGALLQDISLKDAYDFRSHISSKGLSTTTVNKIINCFKIILNHAVDLKYIDTNPITTLKFLPEEDTNIQSLTIEQIQAISSSNLAFKDLYMFTLYTGLRIGEVAALTAEDVVIDDNYIVVSKTLSRFGITSTKSKKVRKVPLTEDCKNIICKYLTKDRLFDIDPRSFTTVILARDCELLGIPKMRFHDLRHTFATRYLASGGNITHLSLILGHSSVKITQDIYVHLNEQDLYNNIQGVNFGY